MKVTEESLARVREQVEKWRAYQNDPASLRVWAADTMELVRELLDASEQKLQDECGDFGRAMEALLLRSAFSEQLDLGRNAVLVSMAHSKVPARGTVIVDIRLEVLAK